MGPRISFQRGKVPTPRFGVQHVPSSSDVKLPLVIAHRGASGYEVENSLAAFRAAASLGADGVELDVHATVDGALVVHHDYSLDGEHLLADLPIVAVRAHRLANGEPIPTLSEALRAIEPQLAVFVEVKSLRPSQDETLLATLAAGPSPERYAVHSFDHRIVRRLKTRQPDLATGVLSASYPIHPLTALQDATAATLWQEHTLVDAPLVEAVHGAAARLFVYTVNRKPDLRRLADLGLDGLTTNFPDVARQVVEGIDA